MWFAYALKSEKDGWLYVGMTSNVERRISGTIVATTDRRSHAVLSTWFILRSAVPESKHVSERSI
jgi:hypothetical protein